MQDLNKYNPEGSALRKDQMDMLKALEFFAQICKEHNIQWWLCSGTLLGAARHKGFIPWDDDMDVSMFRKDYKKLEKILVKMDNEDYFYQCIKTDVEHVNFFGKFRKKKDPLESTDPRSRYFKYNGVGFDIFCIEKSSRVAAHLGKSFYYGLQNKTRFIETQWLRRFLIRSIEVLNIGLLLPIARLIALINPKNQYHYELGSGFYRSAFYKEDILPLSTMEFEGVQFPVPGNTEAYLTKIYGDWRKLPSDDKIRRSLHYPRYIKEIFPEE